MKLRVIFMKSRSPYWPMVLRLAILLATFLMTLQARRETFPMPLSCRDSTKARP